ncbi:MAG TPA: type II toxin-antitoxin system RelE/ParE family toxin [Thermoanaerobaculia bacterium]|nr:type II toxin-antitoxin system RelE/ParE family toxin [Thermoanaerobaculia bacterium]
MVQIVWTDEALAWLREIHDYISADRPDAARRVVAGILDRAEQLAEFPELGQRLRLRQIRDIRVLLYGHYRIAYRLGEDRVEILGVYHGALDIARRLSKSVRPEKD